MEFIVHEADIVLLIANYFRSRGAFETLSSFLLETNQSYIKECNSLEELLFLQRIILQGRWEDVVKYCKLIHSYEPDIAAKIDYLVKKQKYLESLSWQGGGGQRFAYPPYKPTPNSSDDKNSNDANIEISLLLSLLQDLQGLCHETEFNELCSLLTIQNLQDHIKYQTWTVSEGRIKCVEQIIHAITSSKSTYLTTTALQFHSNDGLFRIVAMSLAYQYAMFLQTASFQNKSFDDLNTSSASNDQNHYDAPKGGYFNSDVGYILPINLDTNIRMNPLKKTPIIKLNETIEILKRFDHLQVDWASHHNLPSTERSDPKSGIAMKSTLPTVEAIPSLPFQSEQKSFVARLQEMGIPLPPPRNDVIALPPVVNQTPPRQQLSPVSNSSSHHVNYGTPVAWTLNFDDSKKVKSHQNDINSRPSSRNDNQRGGSDYKSRTPPRNRQHTKLPTQLQEYRTNNIRNQTPSHPTRSLAHQNNLMNDISALTFQPPVINRRDEMIGEVEVKSFGHQTVVDVKILDSDSKTANISIRTPEQPHRPTKDSQAKAMKQNLSNRNNEMQNNANPPPTYIDIQVYKKNESTSRKSISLVSEASKGVDIRHYEDIFTKGIDHRKAQPTVSKEQVVHKDSHSAAVLSSNNLPRNHSLPKGFKCIIFQTNAPLRCFQVLNQSASLQYQGYVEDDDMIANLLIGSNFRSVHSIILKTSFLSKLISNINKEVDDEKLQDHSETFKNYLTDYNEIHKGSVYTMDWEPQSNLLITGSNDKTLMLLSLKIGTVVLPTLRGHNGTIRTVQFRPHHVKSSSLYAVSAGSGDFQPKLWNLTTGETVMMMLIHFFLKPLMLIGHCVTTLMAHKDNVHSIVWINESLLLTSCEKGEIYCHLLQEENFKMIKQLNINQLVYQKSDEVDRPLGICCMKLAVSLDHRKVTVIIGCTHGYLIRLDMILSPIKTSIESMNYQTRQKLHHDDIRSIGLHPLSLTELIVTGSYDHTICIWVYHMKENCYLIRQSLIGHSDKVLCVNFVNINSQETGLIISTGADGKVILWTI